MSSPPLSTWENKALLPHQGRRKETPRQPVVFPGFRNKDRRRERAVWRCVCVCVCVCVFVCVCVCVCVFVCVVGKRGVVSCHFIISLLAAIQLLYPSFQSWKIAWVTGLEYSTTEVTVPTGWLTRRWHFTASRQGDEWDRGGLGGFSELGGEAGVHLLLPSHSPPPTPTPISQCKMFHLFHSVFVTDTEHFLIHLPYP